MNNQIPPRALFAYLDDDHALPSGSVILSQRELVRRAYEDLRPDEKMEFQRELCRRIGDSSRTLGERTRFIEMAAIINPDRQNRRLVSRQIVDDVRDLFRAGVPPGPAGLDYVRRLRCLLELGIVESTRFWTVAYELCGSSCSLVVFTGLYARNPKIALDWLATYLSGVEQRRVLEKVLPALQERGDLNVVEAGTIIPQNYRDADSAEEPKASDWREILLSFVYGSLNSEANRTGPMEYLRDTASHNVLDEMERQERHLREAVDKIFGEWASGNLTIGELKPILRLLTLTREFQSVWILSSLISYLEFLEGPAMEPEVMPDALVEPIEKAILDCLPWFDTLIGNLKHAARGDVTSPHQELFTRVLSILATLRTKPSLSGRVERELVVHSLEERDRMRALVSLTSQKEEATDWMEELDRRLGGGFPKLIHHTLQQYRLHAHLRSQLASLAKWCDDIYTTRDRLAAGSGWSPEFHAKTLLREFAEARESEDVGELFAVIAAGVEHEGWTQEN